MISFQFLITAFVVVIAPGTGVLYTLAIGLGQGRKASIWAALGCTFGILPHLTAAAIGLAAVLHTSALAFQLVKFAGVAYLLWLAWQMVRADGQLGLSPSQAEPNPWTIVRRGGLINLLNPKLSIFFLALLPPFLSGTPETATVEMLALGGTFMVMTFVVFVLYGVFAAAARDRIVSSAAVMRWLNRTFAVLFVALGARLALERL